MRWIRTCENILLNCQHISEIFISAPNNCGNNQWCVEADMYHVIRTLAMAPTEVRAKRILEGISGWLARDDFINIYWCPLVEEGRDDGA